MATTKWCLFSQPRCFHYMKPRDRAEPSSTTKPAARTFPSATSKMTTMKQSLFSQPRCSASTKPRDWAELPSTAKYAAATLPSATSKMTTMKRSLFSQPHGLPSTKSCGGPINEVTSMTSVSLVMTINRHALTPSQPTGLGRELAFHTKVTSPMQRTVPTDSSNI
ncbi:hypothetical protein MRX96_056904 [Rhipicephalus microplus]